MVLLPNLLYCTTHFANFKGILGFSGPSIRPTKTELRARRRKSRWWVEFLPMEGSRYCFILASDKNKVRKISLWSKLDDYSLKWDDHKQPTLKHRNKTNRFKSTNHKLKTMTLWTRSTKYHVFPKRCAKMIDWTEKAKIPLKQKAQHKKYNKFCSIYGRTTLKDDQFSNHAIKLIGFLLLKAWFLSPFYIQLSRCT